MDTPWIVGIDLGTTHCAAAFSAPGRESGLSIEDFDIPQLRRPGEIATQPLLPSCLYLAGDHELPRDSTLLPWGDSPKQIAGEFARWQGARVPGRLIASAKAGFAMQAWTDPAPILPWGAPPELQKISPVDASALLLSHLVSAWNHRFPDHPLPQQEVVITVPASFDEAARALTIEAARRAGLASFTLVEEPQAAFYDFSTRHRDSLARVLDGVRLVLVVDVGGGTTDFSLIRIDFSHGDPTLERIAVGEHLMLGGDNMDAALARQVEAGFLAKGRKLSAAQWTQLVQSARTAKESLLAEDAAESCHLAVAAEGSRLLGGTLSAEIKRDETVRLILDGFLPQCTAEDGPRRSARTALQELGLPYAQDPAITRQLAGFSKTTCRVLFSAQGQRPSASGLPRPDAILLNGGVFNSPRIVRRFQEVASSWWPGMPLIRLLPHSSLDLAVARGAVCYGAARRGLVRRIGGGSAHAFYIGLAPSSNQAVAQSVCVIPRGHEESQWVDLKDQTFNLTLGRPVQFPLYSTTSDRIDRPGDIVPVDSQFLALPPIHTLFQGRSGRSSVMPVHLRGVLTELGTLELWCVSNNTDEKWRLEFELRGAMHEENLSIAEPLPDRFDAVKKEVENVFGKTAKADAREARQLVRTLEKIIGPRESWRLPVLRELWSILFAASGKRRRSTDHERVFYQLLGFSLRPGFGYPLDEWRTSETFKLFADGVQFHSEQPVWNEFWILWRRVAGGLTSVQQEVLWNYLKPILARRVPPEPDKSSPKSKGVEPEGLDQMARTAAALEHIEPSEKIQFGQWIAERLKNPETTPGPWAWILGRLGARAPSYGSGHKTVPAEQAADWLELLLRANADKVEGAAFAIVQIARMTGDRSRDLDDAVRTRALDALKSAQAPERWLRMASEVVALESADQAQILGDSLPVGLRL